MDFNEYQKQARETAIYKEPIIYPALGLGGETGEVLEKIKKYLRDDNKILTEERKEAIQKELGDVLWYLANLATDLDLDLNLVAKLNIEKLKSRKARNCISGEGDNR